jgi:hypothetical protein
MLGRSAHSLCDTGLVMVAATSKHTGMPGMRPLHWPNPKPMHAPVPSFVSTQGLRQRAALSLQQHLMRAALAWPLVQLMLVLVPLMLAALAGVLRPLLPPTRAAPGVVTPLLLPRMLRWCLLRVVEVAGVTPLQLVVVAGGPECCPSAPAEGQAATRR